MKVLRVLLVEGLEDALALLEILDFLGLIAVAFGDPDLL